MHFTAIHRLLGLQPQALTRQVIDEAVAARLPEQSDLDWKRERYEGKADWQEEFAKDVAAMANSGGGLLVLGVNEHRPTSEATTVAGVQPLSDGEERTLRQIAFGRITPPVTGIAFANLIAGENCVVAVWVPPSSDVPHLVYRQTLFGAPFRDGTRTEWMREQQVQAAYRRRFDARSDQNATLDALWDELSANSPSDRRMCFVGVAVPDPPRPGALGRIDRATASDILADSLTVRRSLLRPDVPSPLTDTAGQLTDPQPGPRRMTARYSREQADHTRHRSANGSVHDDGSVSMWWSVGGSLQGPGGGWHEVSASFVEFAIGDLMALLGAAARRLGVEAAYEVRAGLVLERDRPIVIRLPALGASRDADAEHSIPIRRFVPARAGVPAQATNLDLLTIAHGLALDCVSQAGVGYIEHLRGLPTT